MSQKDKDYRRKFDRKLYLVSIAKNKDTSIRIKMHQTSFFIFTTICWVDVVYLTCLVCLFGYFVFQPPLNLKNKITKIEHKKIFCGPSKILKNISWPINICLKYFMTPTKALRPPSYILNVRFLMMSFKYSLILLRYSSLDSVFLSALLLYSM